MDSVFGFQLFKFQDFNDRRVPFVPAEKLNLCFHLGKFVRRRIFKAAPLLSSAIHRQTKESTFLTLFFYTA